MKKSASLRITSAILVATTLFTAGSASADVGEPPVIAVSAAVAGPGGTGTVRRDRCNVRSRPTTTAEVVAQLSKGSEVSILESQTVTEKGKTRAWLRIPLPATAKCYVSAKFVDGGVATGDAINVRCGPGSKFRDVGQLSKGDTVEVTAREGDWVKIKPTADCSGWIAAELVAVTPAAVPAPPAAAVEPPPLPATLLPAPAPAAPEVRMVSTDPDSYEQYTVKVGLLGAVDDPVDAPAPYELLTIPVERRQYRICFLEPDGKELTRYTGKTVRVVGMERWQRGERWPVLKLERLDLVR
ncbi:SH3 domain-containing protein [bacterium]|nr:SH3 domain-containing protein [bacterium]